MYCQEMMNQNVSWVRLDVLDTVRLRIGVYVWHFNAGAFRERSFARKNVRLENLSPQMRARNVAEPTAAWWHRIERNPEYASARRIKMEVWKVLVECDAVDRTGLLDEQLIVVIPDSLCIEQF